MKFIFHMILGGAVTVVVGYIWVQCWLWKHGWGP